MTYIDFGIVTAIKCETDAILTRLEKLVRVRGTPPDIRDYYRSQFHLPDGTWYEIVIVQCSQAGNTDAGQAAKDLITKWNPSSIIMLGVAGGYPREDLRIGDVVVATEIIEYDYKKFFSKVWRPRPRHHLIDANFLAKIHSLPSWEGRDIPFLFQVRRPKLQKPGPIASGNAIFADSRARDRLLRFQQDLIAIEMESEGVASAAWQRNPPIPILVIRGICDLADAATKGDHVNCEKKRALNLKIEKAKEKCQIIAANSAASFMIHFLRDKPVEQRNLPFGIRNRRSETRDEKNKSYIPSVIFRKSGGKLQQQSIEPLNNIGKQKYKKFMIIDPCINNGTIL